MQRLKVMEAVNKDVNQQLKKAEDYQEKNMQQLLHVFLHNERKVHK